MIVETTLLLLPSRAPDPAALRELPRRLASTGGAVAGLLPFRVLGLARAIAEPNLLGEGLRAWDSGHAALLVSRLLEGPHGLRLAEDLSRTPLARALARTLRELRLAGVVARDIASMGRVLAGREDAERVGAVAKLYGRYVEAIEGRFADPEAVLRAAQAQLMEARWLHGAEVLLLDDELEPAELDFLRALANHTRLRRLARERPRALDATAPAGDLEEWAPYTALERTRLAPLVPPPPPPALERLRTSLFEAPQGGAVEGDAVELMTAPGEAHEVRAVARRLLREAARGVPFEEMGVALPRPEQYTALFGDLLERLGIPFRLHPSLPLRCGRVARSLLLLFRCRGLPRQAVMEFLTFAPVPFEELLGSEGGVSASRWDRLSRDAGIVSGYERWLLALRHLAETERQAAEAEPEASRRRRRLQRVAEAESLLRMVELLSSTLEGLAGQATWPEWSQRLQRVVGDWIQPAQESEEQRRILELVADLGGLGSLGQEAVAWRDVEAVVESRLELERLPLEPTAEGSVHIGALDAMAGLPFRYVAIPGLAEGGYPGALRPDPFLLDVEREALARAGQVAAPAANPERPAARQLSLFDDEEPSAPPSSGAARLATTQDRLEEARRLFHRALSQATERLTLSYPRADPRTGRERLPSLFLVAAATALQGRAVGGADLERLVIEDQQRELEVEDAIDPGERDRVRLVRGGAEATEAVASGSPFFRQSRLAARARWHNRLTAYDGLVAPLAEEAARRLNPLTAPRPLSASRLATFTRCGFQYLLQHVLRLEAALEPEERKRLDPLERGSLFHDVAERFLREQRDLDRLPVRDTPEARERLLELAEESLAGLVAGTPPRFALLWDRERQRFRDTLLGWLEREAGQKHPTTPAHFEVSFGLPLPAEPGEPHTEEPVEIDLGEGRRLRVSGKIDRIDRRADGSLSLRDYKTGRVPRDRGGIFRGGKQLQIPFYILAARKLWPETPVVEAFLDYVDGGRRVAVDLDWVRSEGFVGMLRGLVEAIGQGVFVQEPAACEWCDYTEVCGPRPLLQQRRRYKVRDRLLQSVLRLKDLG